MSGRLVGYIVAVVFVATLSIGCKGGGGGSTVARKGTNASTHSAKSTHDDLGIRRSSRNEIPALESPANAAYYSDPPNASFNSDARPQHTCPIDGNPLGNSGTPVAVTLKGEPIFVCSQGCAKTAQKDPDKYLGRVRMETTGRD